LIASLRFSIAYSKGFDGGISPFLPDFTQLQPPAFFQGFAECFTHGKPSSGP
jgi:hypothetical protein